MEVYGYDPYLSVNAAWNLSSEVKHIVNVEDIYKECDYITIHVPALDSTKGMINKEKLDMMKDGVVILNFARDTLVMMMIWLQHWRLEKLSVMSAISQIQR